MIISLDEFLDKAAIDSTVNIRNGEIIVVSKLLDTYPVKTYNINWQYKREKTVFNHLQGGVEVEGSVTADLAYRLDNAAQELLRRGMEAYGARVSSQLNSSTGSFGVRKKKFYSEEVTEMLKTMRIKISPRDLIARLRGIGQSESTGPLFDTGSVYRATREIAQMTNEQTLAGIKTYYSEAVKRKAV